MKIAISSATAASERSPPESSERRSIFFPAGFTLTSMPVVSMSSGFVSEMLPDAAREEHREHLGERRLGVVERAAEDRLHLGVDLLDDRDQVFSSVREVGELLAQELVALFERRELLEGERVHPAQLRELALGRSEAPLLLVALERPRLTALVFGRDLLVGAVLGDEHLFAEAEFGLGAFDESADVQLLLVDAQFEAVHVFGDGVQSLPDRRLVAPHRLQLLVAARALGLGAAERDPGLGDRRVDRRERLRQHLGHPAGRLELGATDDGSACGVGGGLALGVELRLHRPDARLLGPHPLLRGLEPELRLDLGFTRRLERRERALARRGVEHRPGRRPHEFEGFLRRGGGALGVGDPLLGVRRCLPQSLGVGLGRLGLHAGPVELLGALGELRVELAQRREGALRLVLRLLDDLPLLGELVAAALDLGAHLFEARRGSVAFGDELDAALLLPRAAAQHEASDHGAVLRDDGGGARRRRDRRRRSPRGSEVVGDEHLGEQCRARRRGR